MIPIRTPLIPYQVIRIDFSMSVLCYLLIISPVLAEERLPAHMCVCARHAASS